MTVRLPTGQDPNLDTDGVRMQRMKPLANTDGLLFRGKGVTGTALKAVMSEDIEPVLIPTVTNIEYQVPEERYINGTRLMLQNQHFDDFANLEIWDHDGVLGLGPIPFSLNNFAETWNFVSDQEDQGLFVLPYPAKLTAGLYVRLVYTAHGVDNDVKIKINYILHKKQTAA